MRERGEGGGEINLVPPPIGHSLSAHTSSGWRSMFSAVFRLYTVHCLVYTSYIMHTVVCTHYTLYTLSTVQHTWTTDIIHTAH